MSGVVGAGYEDSADADVKDNDSRRTMTIMDSLDLMGIGNESHR
jgi:hypothetical protein